MKIKNNYNECITNLACSIQKYFELDYKHNTLDYIDLLLKEKKPQNVIIMLFDGMGSRIIDKVLNKDDLFIKNRFKEITTVFPATTTAATTSIRTGLNPVEHGWLAWNTYIKPIDKTITMFLGTEKENENISKEYLELVKTDLRYDTIVDEINSANKYRAYELASYKNSYKNLDDMLIKVKQLTEETGKKYIYAYDSEPDHSMHNFGSLSNEAKSLIKERNDKVTKFIKDLKNTVVIIIADHGHRDIENIYLKDYPTIKDLLERVTSNEPRSCLFKVKSGKLDEFKIEFNKYLGNDFELYSKEDIIKNKLYGDGIPHSFFDGAVGDFIAIASNSHKALLDIGDEVLKSAHAGYSDEEIMIPLIIIDKTN